MKTNHSSVSGNNSCGIVDPQIAEALMRRSFGGETSMDADIIAAWRKETPNHDRIEALLQRISLRSEVIYGSSPQIDVKRNVMMRLRGERTTKATAIGFPLRIRSRYLVSAALAVGVCVSIAGVSLLEKYAGSGSYAAYSDNSLSNEYVTKRGETAQIELTDGSIVTLGPESKLQYSRWESGSLRSVNLEGQGYFKIVHNPSRPFVVYTGNAAVQELGTEFEVVSFPEDSSVRVIVKNGRVALRQKTSDISSGTVLSSRDAGELNRAGLLTVRSGLDLQEELSWLDRRLVFKSVQVKQVINTLERWHDIKIEVADVNVMDQLITVEFSHQPISEVVEQLAVLLNLQVESVANRVRLY